MGSAAVLAKLDKDYLPAARGVVKSSAGNLPYETYMQAETLNPNNPEQIGPGKTATARLVVGERDSKMPSTQLKLRLLFRNFERADSIQVQINGRDLKMKPDADGWLEGAPSTGDLQTSSNAIAVRLSPQATKPLSWLDLLLEVRHNKVP